MNGAKFWRSILHRIQSTLARTFLVFATATALLLAHRISEQTWLYIALAFVAGEKAKDAIVALAERRKP